VKALEVCQSTAPFDVYDVNQNVMPLAPMSPTLLAATTNGGTAVSLAYNNHINALIGQVQSIILPCMDPTSCRPSLIAHQRL